MTNPATDQKRRLLDGLSILLSGTCLVHCLALPILVTLYPIAQGNFMDENTFHTIMLVFILPASLIALTIGCREHKDKLTMILGGIGLGTLTVTALWGHDLVGLFWERIITSVGGAKAGCSA